MGFCCFLCFAFLLVNRGYCSGRSAVAGTLVESGGCLGPPADTGWLVEMGKGFSWLSKVTRASNKTESSRTSSDHDEWEVAAAAGEA